MPNDRPGDGGPLSTLGINVAAFAWGWAEATLFFLIPEVVLTSIALHDARAAWLACFWCLAGALIGGTLMYTWGAYNFEGALVGLDRVPGVNRAMSTSVEEQLRAHGAWALFNGPVSGTPYKVYAVHAGAIGIPFVVFLLVSVPARLARFLLVTGLVILICRFLPGLGVWVRRLIHIGLWTAFYAWFFLASRQ